MSFMYVLAMTAAELVGNAHLKWFADEGKHHNLMFGILAWMAVLFFLIKTLSSASMMWTCIMWEAMIVIGGAITAWLFLARNSITGFNGSASCSPSLPPCVSITSVGTNKRLMVC